MFTRGIRGISIDNNISAVASKEKDLLSSSSLARQLFSSESPPIGFLATPKGEALALTVSKDQTDLSKLTVYGVCMNMTGAKIYKNLSDKKINIMCMSLCDIAASFVISSKDQDSAIDLIRSNFTLEV